MDEARDAPRPDQADSDPMPGHAVSGPPTTGARVSCSATRRPPRKPRRRRLARFRRSQKAGTIAAFDALIRNWPESPARRSHGRLRGGVLQRDFMPFSQVKIDPMDRGSWWATACSTSRGRSTARASACASTSTGCIAREVRAHRPGPHAERAGADQREVISRNEHLRADVGDYQLWQFVTGAAAAGPTRPAARGRHLHAADGLRPVRQPTTPAPTASSCGLAASRRTPSIPR